MKPGSLARESHSTQVVERNGSGALVVHVPTMICYELSCLLLLIMNIILIAIVFILAISIVVVIIIKYVFCYY